MTVIVAVVEPFLAGGARFFESKKAAIVVVCDDFGHLELIASCSIFVEVHGCLFKAIATKYLAVASVG